MFKIRAFSLLTALFLSIFLTGCGGGSSNGNGDNTVNTVNAEIPNITAQPIDADYTQGNTPIPLSISANVNDGGVLSYQWYKTSKPDNNGELISGATSSTYTPSTSEVGITYYYVVITNTNNNVNGNKTASVKSSVVKIVVDILVITNAQTPVITIQPTNASYVQGDTAIPLSISANVNDGGVLSYQWYKTSKPDNNGELISGATSQTYTPSTSNIGMVYYYVVVTNTNNNVNGNKVVSSKSDAVQIIINTLTTHLINFYDENLDFIEGILVNGGIINPSNVKPGTWYKANETSVLTNHNLNESIVLYAVPNVQEITNQSELRNVRSGNYILLNDIFLDENGAGFEDGDGWKPNFLSGIFNGNNNKITNLWINRPSTLGGTGLFGSVVNSQIRNLGVEAAKDKEIRGNSHVGGIAGQIGMCSSITNSYFNG